MIKALVGILVSLMLIGCGQSQTMGTTTSGTGTGTGTPGSTGRPVANHAIDGFYTMSLVIGGQTFNDIQIDTASSNLIVLGDQTICPTCLANLPFSDFTPATFTPTGAPLYNGETYSIQYGIGHGTAELFQTTVALPNAPSISYPVGVFESGQSIQSIVGLGYQANVVSVKESTPLPFFDVYAAQNNLKNLFTLNLCPRNLNGSFVTFGTIDPSVNASTIQYTKIIQDTLLQTPQYDYYNIAPISLSIGGQQIATFPTQSQGYLTIVDSGSTLLYLPDTVLSAVATYFNNSSGISTDFWDLDISNPVAIESANFLSQLQDLQIQFPNASGSGTFTVNVSPQTYVINLGSASNPKFISAMKSVAKSTTNATSIVFGDAFLQNTYAIFDRDNQQLGFAPSLCTSNVTTSALVKGRMPLIHHKGSL